MTVNTLLFKIELKIGTLKKERRKLRQTAGKIAMTVLMCFVALCVLIPFIYMISSSLKREIDIFKYPVDWMPSNIVNNYREVWQGNYNFYLYYFNSVKVTVLTVLGVLLTSSLAAYGFSKVRFKGREALFLLYLSTLMIPTQVTLVPRFLLFKFIGLYDTHYSLILPGIFTAFGVFLLRQFMISIPYELNSSAMIDGAGEFRTWLYIIAPLTKSAMVTLALISLVWSWNDYINPLIFLKSNKLLTIPLGLLSFIDETGKQYSLIMAASVSATIPPVLFFIAGQKYFIEGLTSGAVKG